MVFNKIEGIRQKAIGDWNNFLQRLVITNKGMQITLHWKYGGATNIFSAFCHYLEVVSALGYI